MSSAPTTAEPLPCREVIGFLWAYLDGELDDELRSEFDRHLALCPSCVAYLATYRQTIGLARAAAREPEEEAAALPAELAQAILAARR